MHDALVKLQREEEAQGRISFGRIPLFSVNKSWYTGFETTVRDLLMKAI